MLVYRLTRAKYTRLDGQAAKLYGGRWNHPGCALVYTAESRALAVLETRVHLSEPPKDYVCMVLDIPMGPDNRRDEIRATPEWRTREKFTKDFGASWCRANRRCVLQVPSVVIPEESNYLINPSHPLAPEVKIMSVDPIDFDLRLWRPTDYR